MDIAAGAKKTKDGDEKGKSWEQLQEIKGMGMDWRREREGKRRDEM